MKADPEAFGDGANLLFLWSFRWEISSVQIVSLLCRTSTWLSRIQDELFFLPESKDIKLLLQYLPEFFSSILSQQLHWSQKITLNTNSSGVSTPSRPFKRSCRRSPRTAGWFFLKLWLFFGVMNNLYGLFMGLWCLYLFHSRGWSISKKCGSTSRLRKMVSDYRPKEVRTSPPFVCMGPNLKSTQNQV